MTTTPRFKIGDIVINLISEANNKVFNLGVNYREFISQDKPDITLRIHSSHKKIEIGEQVFQSGGVWSLHNLRDKWIIRLHSPTLGSEPFQTIVLCSDFTSGDIYYHDNFSVENTDQFPLDYPFGELLLVNLLSRGRGVLLHAIAIKEHQVGLLFAGKSGAGKSTTARLWSGKNRATLLSDDRVIVRKQDDNFWIYGTPWHGDARVVSPDSALLERIFILKHGSQNKATRLEPMEAAARLLVRSFPTYWDKDGMDFTLQFLDELCEMIPCYELGFVPDQSAVDFVRSMSAI